MFLLDTKSHAFIMKWTILHQSAWLFVTSVGSTNGCVSHRPICGACWVRHQWVHYESTVSHTQPSARVWLHMEHGDNGLSFIRLTPQDDTRMICTYNWYCSFGSEVHSRTCNYIRVVWIVTHMHTYTCTYIHTHHIYTYHTYMHTHTHTHTHTYIHTHPHSPRLPCSFHTVSEFTSPALTGVQN